MTKIKKRFAACLTAAACLTGSISAMTANALDIGFSFDAAAAITIETETFTYVPNFLGGFDLTTDIVAPDFMVIGVKPNQGSCLVARVNHDYKYDGIGYLSGDLIEGDLPQIGDFLKSADEVAVLEVDPPRYVSYEGITNLGNGADLLGDEFKRVIRLQAITVLADIDRNDLEGMYKRAEEYGIIDYFGDVNVDDTVDILDCITVNKQLLGSEQLSDYVRVFGDVNGDGVLDATDSLMILKEVVGLTENFEEV